MVWKRVVIGIGNPGADYEDTRHNVGFAALDRFAEQAGLTFQRLECKGPDGRKLFGGKTKARVAMGVSGAGEPYLLAKPLTYVNLSGDVAGPLLAAAGLGPDALFVIVDDLNLPLGRLKCRPSGSHGGHNGLRHIESVLSTRDYPRLRLGIGPVEGAEVAWASHQDQVDHVLGTFLPEERSVLDPILDRSVAAMHAWLDGTDFTELMGTFNGTVPASKEEPNDGPVPGS